MAQVDDCRIRFAFGSSGTLAKQIQSGADYDLYLSANQQFVVDLVKSGKADAETVTLYGKGRLGLYSRKNIRVEELSSPAIKHLAIANPKLAPYGLAAQQFLEAKNLLSQLKGKLVYGGNVRQAFQFAETSNADAAIVSWTLVHNKGGIMLDESLHQPILQSGVVPRRSKNPEAARRFLRYLVSPAGQKILREHGLQSP